MMFKLDSSGVCYVVRVKVLRSSLLDRRSLLILYVFIMMSMFIL